MRLALIDATAEQTKDRFAGLAYRYVRWELERRGLSLVEPAQADVVMVTAVAAPAWKTVRAALRRAGVQPLRAKRSGGQRVILGGQAGMEPAIFDPIADLICVGEGENFLASLLDDGWDAAARMPNAWVPGETREVVPDEDFPWGAPPIKAGDGIVRIYASRGCQKKCLFCQTGWQQVYRENDAARLESQYRRLRAAGVKVNVVTNDAPALSFFDGIDHMEHFSASYSQTQEILKSGSIEAFSTRVKSLRFGVEAPATRLRYWIGKPIPTMSLYDLSVRLLNEGVGVRWFMIAGLPGEQDGDYDELREVIMRARHEIKHGMLQLSFTAFVPESAVPLGVAPVEDSYYARFRAFNDWRRLEMNTRRVVVFNPGGPKTRMGHAVGSMGASEAEIRRGWLEVDPPNWRVRYPLRHVIRKAYDVYARKAGLPLCLTSRETDGILLSSRGHVTVP